MHTEAFDWLSRYGTDEPVDVLDIGGRNINGSVRPLYPRARFVALDILPGDGVDIVADAASWTPDREYDIVTCAEVFEHTRSWRAICRTANRALRPGGRFIVTCAGPGRVAHSQINGALTLALDEWYENIEPSDLRNALVATGFIHIVIDQLREDVRAAARKWGP